jgi:lysophospholipase L1-like esterase
MPHISYLALGDSYTVGTGVEPRQSFPHQLAAALTRNYAIEVHPPRIVAKNGWRTDNLFNALGAGQPRANFDLVTLLIGVNDQYQGFKPEGYGDRFVTLLQRAKLLAADRSDRVFVISIPDYAFTPFGGNDKLISQGINRFNRTASSIVERSGVSFLNVTGISREGLDDPQLVTDDDLHPSSLQYRRWVEEVLVHPIADRIRRRD